MAIRSNHYERAFEEFLRGTRVPHVVVDEKRRSLLGDGSLKSLDFVVHSPGEWNLLIDVKGRKFPSGGTGRSTWENWAEEDDVRSMLAWERIFGDGFRALLVFAYDVTSPRYASRFEALFAFRGRVYAFYGVWVRDFAEAMRTRSPSWQTWTLPQAEFRRLRTPMEEFLQPVAEVA